MWYRTSGIVATIVYVDNLLPLGWPPFIKPSPLIIWSAP